MKKKILYWLPRVLGIILICFIALLSFDVFSMEGTLLKKIGGFLIHNIPTYIFIALLVFAWKNEKMGGIIFIIASLFWVMYIGGPVFFRMFSPLSLPPLIIGILFLLNSWQAKKSQ